jgi:protein TonB
MPDINLNSKEWIDLVFEGRNKRFGAYLLRKDSARRNTIAALIVLSFFAFILLVFFLIGLAGRSRAVIRPSSVHEISTLTPIEQKLHVKVKHAKTMDSRLVARSPKQVGQVSNKLLPFPGTGAKLDEGSGTSGIQLVSGDGGTPIVSDSPVHSDAPTAVPESAQTEKIEEQLPEFPGGIVAFMKWLTKNLMYPQSARQKKIEGKVVVAFIVNKDGSISDAKVVSPVSPELDKEALRLMSLMPRWEPGIENGKPCRTMFVIPIVFKLQ